ncbi:MAG: AlwI family type II restriction endonuclease [Candidatus Jacksonbacteria bacterium]|jgi:hypothetical protein|nr:AlwI family type II restriction endonuclease [Candidatus Jacksonbacteria bacterium]MBT6034585.1 AlwI family type II restriction endonuclease [Candidatus Jacksonbacteria bacterium]MBT6300844.1 AlwI family type II restriction endonuclease [Candidatus Jacksonbacteria bacterium]MBT6757820.1 AlwI family type II restriction endonuclease [Candidatus Jacksonbacteria bacterium]MBT6955130.1 AlwI family type II restriction endonuclease [Candidatus Jacksonbacteria bacterium]
MKKPWSITTTTRSPYRLRDQLRILKDEFSGLEWTRENQINFQIALIQHRLYGHNEDTGFSNQFLLGLSDEHKEIFTNFSHNLTFKEAREIFDSKNYTDPSMRGRQSFNPFKKFGFVLLENGVVKITDFGEHFLSDEYDLSEIFFRSFIKWQLPNPDNTGYKLRDGYDIKPFIGSLHLVKEVNSKWETLGNSPVGLSKKEFLLFSPTLINFEDISERAQKVIDLRLLQQGKSKREQKEIFDNYQQNFAEGFLETDNSEKTRKLLSNLRDYGDNAIRYFRLTKLIFIRGNGHYIDLEPRRSIEIDSLLAYDNAQSKTFESKDEYLAYISDISEPKLPWETTEKYIEIIEKLLEEIKIYESNLQKENIAIQDFQSMQSDELKKYIAELRVYRRELQNEESHKKSQAVEQIEYYIESLENIFDFEDRPILLEKLSALGLHALNDALKIKPNYPVGDDNEPTFTAPANTPDIECFYENFNAICEVTMLNGRDQWYNEGQPVMRHLRDFEQKHDDKPSYCLFIAPTLHRDTINTFWTAIKYEYEGQPQRIIPLSISQFVSVLRVLVQMKSEKKFLQHAEISRLYDEILNSSKSFSDSNEWLQNIPSTISAWKESLISQT